ncbi:MAG: Tfp pilus assembly protein FimT/FimU [Dehalococcoidia bacterium]
MRHSGQRDLPARYAQQAGLPVREAGFSMLEMLVVVLILMILGAFALPVMMRSIRNYQMESAGRQSASSIRRAGYGARPRTRQFGAALVRVGGGGGQAQYILDLVPAAADADNDPCNDPNPAFNPAAAGVRGDPYIVTAPIIEWFNNDTPTLPPATGLPAGYNFVATPGLAVAPANYQIIFSPRGTVETWNGVNYVISNQVQMITLRRLMPQEFDAVLIAVTPVGKVKLFRFRVGTAQWEQI